MTQSLSHEGTACFHMIVTLTAPRLSLVVLLCSTLACTLRVVESLKHISLLRQLVVLSYFLAMILWRWWTAYLCILSIDIPAVVSEKNCRTRFLCIRPTTDNVSSILVGNINDDVSTKVSYNHGKISIATSRIVLYCLLLCDITCCLYFPYPYSI